MLVLHVSVLYGRRLQESQRIPKLPEDDAHTASKLIVATLIFLINRLPYFEYAFRWFYFVLI
jgi:hypothetical protein